MTWQSSFFTFIVVRGGQAASEAAGLYFGGPQSSVEAPRSVWLAAGLGRGGGEGGWGLELHLKRFGLLSPEDRFQF